MSPAYSRVLTALERCGCRPRPQGDGKHSFVCPAHDDHKPSGVLSEGDDGRALIWCGAGCACEKIVQRVGLTMTDLFADEANSSERRIVQTYDYVDEAGILLYQVVRYDPKDFRQRRPDGAGGWVWKMANVRRVLYQLPNVIEAVRNGETIYVTEGEKDADAINRLDGSGFVATCNVGGAGKWRGEYNATLQGARVVIVKDKDEPNKRGRESGREHALDVAYHLRPIASSVEIVEAKTGKDAADHLAAGYGLQDFVPCVPSSATTATSSPIWTPETLEGVLDPDAGEVEHIVEGLIPSGAVTIVGASWKSGKTLAMYSLALSVVSGRRVFDHYRVPSPVRVGIFQLEMPLREDHRRFRRLAIGLGMMPEEVVAYARDGQLVHYSRPRMNLAREEDIEQFHRIVRERDLGLVFVDSLIRAFAGHDINDNVVVPELFADAFSDLTSEGRAIALPHHKRKAPQGGKPDDDKSSLLAAQAWGASADRVFLLDRLPDKGKDGTTFRCRLHLPGSWTPEEQDETILEVKDSGEGTTVRAVSEASAEIEKTLTKAQRASHALAKLVREKVSVLQKDVVVMVIAETGIGERTVKEGLAYAKAMRWIDARPDASGEDNRIVLTPGEAIEEVL